MGRLFGTDGVRGVANVQPMTAEMALEIGRATAYVCKRHPKQRHTIVIGKDTRVSGYMLETALTAGICSMGVDVLLVGPMPTPGIAFITRSMRADAGMVISASHNPYQDNGIKIFSRDGFKLPDAEEDEIEDLITSGRIKDIRPTADEIGKAHRIDDAMGRYIVFCKNTFPGGPHPGRNEDRARLRQRRDLQGGSHDLFRTGRGRDGHSLRAGRDQHQRSLRLAAHGGPGGQGPRSRAPTSAWRSTATATG